MHILNPYEDAFNRQWFKGDIHIHSDLSDGRATLSGIRERLRECGFDFAALADHDRYSSPDEQEFPMLIGNSEMRSAEGGDVLTLFAESQFESEMSVQDLIDQTRSENGLPILAHPKIGEFGTKKHHWAYQCHELIGKYHGYAGMEIYTHNLGSGFQTAIDRLDAVWIASCRDANEPVDIWGLAASDAHDLERITSNVGILVSAAECTAAPLHSAIQKGAFYSLAGSRARFTDISVDGNRLNITAENTKMIRLKGCPQAEYTGDRTTLAVKWAGEKESMSCEYEINGTEGFVRAEAADRDGNFIYANPIRIIA